MANMPALARIALITTGGTIAGVAASSHDPANYRAGLLNADALLAAASGIDEIAVIDTDPLFSIDSKNITTTHWLTLAKRVEWQRQRDDIDAVVITHGTDTLEETAYFLHLVLSPGKPVILTAAMRPANARSADGPMNLIQAIKVAANGITRDTGVVVVMNNRIFGARDVTKTNTQSLDAITAPNSGPLGWADPPCLLTRPTTTDAGIVPLAELNNLNNLPAVEIIYVGGGSTPVFLNAAIASRLDGIVLALPGNGSVPDDWQTALTTLTRANITTIRASRVGAGPVSIKPDDKLPCAGWLSPAKARIALMLSLAVEPIKREALIQTLFEHPSADTNSTPT